MSLFKRAAARGVAHELVRNGLANFGTKQAMEEAADTAADMMMHHAPDMSGDEGHDPETVAALAERLMAIADELEGMGHGDKHASESLQIEAQGDVMKLASEAALAVMEKAAYETRTAAVMEGGDKGNTEMQAATADSVAGLDLKNRPPGYAEDSRGRSELDTTPGMVGHLSDASGHVSRSDAGLNSANEDAKQASIRKLATALIMGGDKGNSAEQAAAHNDVGQLDQKNRPTGYAVVGKGGANFSEPQAARVGQERKPDVSPSRTVSGTNSVIDASHAKAAAEQAVYMDMFRKTAADVGPYLPGGLSDDLKIAAIQHMMPLDRSGRQTYITAMHQAKQAEIADLMEALHEKKETKSEEKKEHASGGYEQGEKKEEKGEKEEAKKEGAAILDAIRRATREATSYR